MGQRQHGACGQRDRDGHKPGRHARHERSTASPAGCRGPPRQAPSAAVRAASPARPISQTAQRQHGREQDGERECEKDNIGGPGAVGDEELGVVAEQFEQRLRHGNRPQGRNVEPHHPTHALSITGHFGLRTSGFGLRTWAHRHIGTSALRHSALQHVSTPALRHSGTSAIFKTCPKATPSTDSARTLKAALAGRLVTGFRTVLPHLARVDVDTPLAGRTVDDVVSRGKHILMHFSGDLILRTHMRMHGSWHLYRPGERWRAAWARHAHRDRHRRVRGGRVSCAGRGVPHGRHTRAR